MKLIRTSVSSISPFYLFITDFIIPGKFLVNNYKQAISILNGEAAFFKQMHNQNIANTSVFQEWLAEEKAYLKGLSREPLLETLEMEYWQKLVNLAASQ